MTRNRHNPSDVSDLPMFQIRQPSRNTDPDTSHEAARALMESGELNAQCMETLAALVRFCFATKTTPTSAELAGDDTRLRYKYARRLPDLEQMGLVERFGSKRVCKVTGRRALPWSVTESGMQRFRERIK